MKGLDIFVYSIRNIKRGGTKTALCILAFCVGVSSVLIMITLGDFARDVVDAELNQIGVGGMAFYTQSNSFAVTRGHLEAVSSVDGVSAAMPMSLHSAGAVINGKSLNAAVVGTSERLSEIFKLTMLFGRLFTTEDVENASKVIVIDDSLALSAYKRVNIVGKTLSLTIDNAVETYEIIGIAASQKQGVESLVGASIPSFLYAPHTAVSEMLGINASDKIAVACIGGASSGEVAKKVKKRLDSMTSMVFRHENLDQYTSSIKNIAGIVSLLAGAVAGVSIIVGGFGVMGAMVAAVEGRTREIGIYKALGAKRRDVLASFLTESQIICLSGGLLGLGFNYFVFFVLSRALGIIVRPDEAYFLYCLAGACLCGMIFGIMPALRAARLNPIDAIRDE